MMPLVSMSDKRLGGMANSSLSNLRAIWLLASSTSLMRYPRVSLSVRSLSPPFSCTSADPQRAILSRFRGRNQHELPTGFSDFETEKPSRLQRNQIGRAHV